MVNPAQSSATLASAADGLSTIAAASVDLLYLDPPFNTGRVLADRNGRYRDQFPSIAHYLDFLKPVLIESHRVLKPTGSILLHCDWRTCHHLRIALDDIFSPANFVNHLIWSYGLGGSSPRRFARKHDDILFYARSPEYYFLPPRVPATSARLRGQHKKSTDVLSIPSINNMAAERTGYPTQKPLALLKLLIEACCPPHGLVIDPFCGSGTTLVAAQQLGRRAQGFDINPEAIKITRQRLTNAETSITPP